MLNETYVRQKMESNFEAMKNLLHRADGALVMRLDMVLETDGTVTVSVSSTHRRFPACVAAEFVTHAWRGVIAAMDNVSMRDAAHCNARLGDALEELRAACQGGSCVSRKAGGGPRNDGPKPAA